MLTTQELAKGENNAQTVLTDSSGEAVAEYISHLAHDLSKMAQKAKFETVAYLLEMVVIEANSHRPGISKSRRSPNKCENSEK